MPSSSHPEIAQPSVRRSRRRIILHFSDARHSFATLAGRPHPLDALARHCEGDDDVHHPSRDDHGGGLAGPPVRHRDRPVQLLDGDPRRRLRHRGDRRRAAVPRRGRRLVALPRRARRARILGVGRHADRRALHRHAERSRRPQADAARVDVDLHADAARCRPGPHTRGLRTLPVPGRPGHGRHHPRRRGAHDRVLCASEALTELRDHVLRLLAGASWCRRSSRSPSSPTSAGAG